jgi:hypothetical protein
VNDSDRRPEDIERFEGLVELLGETDPDVRAGQMFGMPTIMWRRRAIGGPRRAGFVFKLTGPEHAEALALQGAHLFDPGESDRPMKQWVVVPDRHESEYERLARAALRDIRTG